MSPDAASAGDAADVNSSTVHRKQQVVRIFRPPIAGGASTSTAKENSSRHQLRFHRSHGYPTNIHWPGPTTSVPIHQDRRGPAQCNVGLGVQVLQISGEGSRPSPGIPAFRTFGSVLFFDGHVQVMLAGFPLPLLTVQLSAVEFATGRAGPSGTSATHPLVIKFHNLRPDTRLACPWIVHALQTFHAGE